MLAENDQELRTLLEENLNPLGYSVHPYTSKAGFHAVLKGLVYHVAIIGHDECGVFDISLARFSHQKHPDVDVIGMMDPVQQVMGLKVSLPRDPAAIIFYLLGSYQR